MIFILRIWIYLSPALYSLDRIPEKFQMIFMLNPFAPIFISYRDIIMYARAPHAGYLSMAFLISMITLVSGFFFFYKNERNIAKVL